MATQLPTPRDTVLIIRSDEEEDITAVANLVRRTTAGITSKIVADAVTSGTLTPFFDEGDVQRHGRDFLTRVISNITTIDKSTRSGARTNETSTAAQSASSTETAAVSTSNELTQYKTQPNPTTTREQPQHTSVICQHQAPSQQMPVFGEDQNAVYPNFVLCFFPPNSSQPFIDNGFYSRTSGQSRTVPPVVNKTRWAKEDQMINALQEGHGYSNPAGLMGSATQIAVRGVGQEPYYWNQPVIRRPRGKSLLKSRNAPDQFKLRHNSTMNQADPMADQTSSREYGEHHEQVTKTVGCSKTNEAADRFEKMNFKENKMASKARRSQLHSRHRTSSGSDNPSPRAFTAQLTLQESIGNHSHQPTNSSTPKPPKRKPKKSKGSTQDAKQGDTLSVPVPTVTSHDVIDDAYSRRPTREFPQLENRPPLSSATITQHKDTTKSVVVDTVNTKENLTKPAKPKVFVPAVPDISLLYKAEKPVSSKVTSETTAFPQLDTSIKPTEPAPSAQSVSPADSDNSSTLTQRSRRCSAVQILKQHTKRRLSQPVSPGILTGPVAPPAASLPFSLPNPSMPTAWIDSSSDQEI